MKKTTNYSLLSWGIGLCLIILVVTLTTIYTQVVSTDPHSRPISAVITFSVPLLLFIFYSIIISSENNKKVTEILKNNQIYFVNYFVCVGLLLTLYNLPFPQLNTWFYIVVVLILFCGIYFSSIPSNTSFATSLLFLLLIPVYLFFNDINQSEKAAVWVFTFLVIGVVQRLFDRGYE